jgi:PAS domain-containing protein
MTGYTEDEIKTMEDWYKKAYPDQESREKAKKYFQYDIENDIKDRTYKIKTAAGNYKYFNFRYSQLDGGKMLFEIIDISYRIKQKQELKNQKIIFENLFTNSLEGIVLLDQDLNIIDANKKFREIFEVAEKDIIDKNINQVAVPKLNSEDINKAEKIFLQDQEWEKEIPYRCLSRKLSHLVKNFFEYYFCRSLFKSSAG